MKNIKSFSLCCGCEACAAVCPKACISIQQNEDGFYIAHADDDICIQCGLCSSVCPVNQSEPQTDHAVMKTIAAKNRDLSIRKQSASGGMYSALSSAVFALGEATVYGAVYDEKGMVRHQGAISLEECGAQRGSKYVQSDMNGTIASLIQDLKAGKYVLFTGTPCQCAGVRNAVRLKKVPADKLFLVDIFCHGVPSPMMLEKFIGYLKKKYRNFRRFEIRSTSAEWGVYRSVVHTATAQDSSSLLSQAYIKLFCTDACLNECCYACKFCNTNRPGDISIGDFWGLKKVSPAFHDQIGVSAMLVNTEKGMRLLERIKGSIEFVELSENDCTSNQHNLQFPTVRKPNTDTFRAELRTYPFGKFLRKYGGLTMMNKAKHTIKKVLKINR